MQINTINRFILISILIINSSCIDEFYPHIGEQERNKIIVFGQITDVEGYQTVSIATSSSIEKPQELPLSGCNVTIIDDKGNSFKLDEYKKGQYRVWITKDYLKPGISYCLKITTNSGDEIVSDFDQMQECPDVDSVYYIRQDILTTDPNKPLQGIQFYINMDASNVNSRYYKWEIEETWEHHASYPKLLYWDGFRTLHLSFPDYSTMVCWSTKVLKNVYTFSTENFAQNRIIKHPLHFVDNLTQRLTFGYSILVKQYALSYIAYSYWEQQRVNNELGGLYGKQPISISGNFKNISSPEKQVLGIFQATGIRSKRIFIQNVKDLDLCYPVCDPACDEPYKLYPGYLDYLLQRDDGAVCKLERQCVECFFLGGSTLKPDFWPY